MTLSLRLDLVHQREQRSVKCDSLRLRSVAALSHLAALSIDLCRGSLFGASLGAQGKLVDVKRRSCGRVRRAFVLRRVIFI